MDADRSVIAWAILRNNYLLPGLAIEQPVGSATDLRLFYNPGARRLGALLRVRAGTEWRRGMSLRNITARQIAVGGEHYVEVSSGTEELWRPIYALICDVAARIADGQSDGLEALESGLDDFETLVAQGGRFSRERAIGLFGELFVLDQMLDKGIGDAGAWIGHSRQSHDIRIGKAELEVKTTLANSREHFIHGAHQLTPSPGCSLRLVSVRLAIPGTDAGQTLNGLVGVLRRRISEPALLKAFNAGLQSSGYDPEDEECATPYKPAAPPVSILIGTDLPALMPNWLGNSVGADMAGRMRQINFTLNCEGLGLPFDVNEIT